MATEHPFQLLFESFGRIPAAHAEPVNKVAHEALSKALDVSVEAPGRCILLRAPRAGHGKTHLLSRVQHQLGGTHEFIPLHASGTRVDALSVTEDALKRLSRPLPAGGGLTVLDLIIRRLFSFALQPLVISGEVPCQDREGALAALKTRPVETFDFHHPNAVTAHWAKENFDVLGPRLSMELSQRSGVAIREVSFWVTAFFHFASTPIDHPGRTSALALEVAGETISEGVALERLFALLGMLSLLVRVVLVADDLEGFSADETAALRFAAFVVAIRQAVDRVDVILSLNKDIWETAFLPRLSGGLADRLSEVLIELEPLKDEEIIALFESRAPGFGEQLKSRLKSEDRHARGLIRAAGHAWLAADEPEAAPPVRVEAPPLQQEPVMPPPPPVSPPVFRDEPVQPPPAPESLPEPVRAVIPPSPPQSVFFPEEQPAQPSPFQAVPPAQPAFSHEEKAPAPPVFEAPAVEESVPRPPAPPEPSVFQAVAPEAVPPPVATPVVAEPVFSDRPFEAEFASPFHAPQVQGREDGAERRPKEQPSIPSWNKASVFDAQVVDEPPVQPFGPPPAFQPSLQAAPPAPEPAFQPPPRSVFEVAPDPAFAPPPPPVFQPAPAEPAFTPPPPPAFQPAPSFQPPAQSVFQPASPDSPFQAAPQPVFQAPPAEPVFQQPPAQSPFQIPQESVFQAAPAAPVFAAEPQQAAPSPFQAVFESESDSGFTIPQGVAVPPEAPAQSPFQAASAWNPPVYNPSAPAEQPAVAPYAPASSPFGAVGAPPSAVAYGEPAPHSGGIPASFGPPAPPQQPAVPPLQEAEPVAEPVKAAQEEGDRVDELLRQFRERYGRGGL